MNTKLTVVVVLFFVILAAAVALIFIPAPQAPAPAPVDQTPATSTSTQEGVLATPAGIPDVIYVDTPLDHGVISSPLNVTGKARGSWYFEASFPMELRDQNDKVLAQGPAQAQSDWMTTDFVIFKATLSYPAQPAGSAGTLVLKKDNPSGDPERDQSLTIPIVFK